MEEKENIITGEFRVSWTIKKDAMLWVVGAVCFAIGSIITLLIKYISHV